jgi:tetratricopeptide (TPR) repeat protein
MPLSGTHLWADRFDGSLEDVFELQDQVAVSVAGVIEPALQAAEMRRSAARPTTDLSAYDLYLRALASFFPTTRERVLDPLWLFEQAIAIDRHYGPALAWASNCHIQLVREGWSEDPETSRRKAGDLARQALQETDNDPGILANSALALAYFGEDIAAMMGLVDRALAVNPSYARGWFVSGILRLWAGQPDIAIEHVETSLRLSPRERMGPRLATMGIAFFFKRQFAEATSKLLLSCKTIQAFPPHTAFSPRVMPIWGGSTKRETLSSGCARLPLRCCRAICLFVTPRTASCSCRAYAWRSVRGECRQANALITSDKDAAKLTPTIHLRAARSVSILANRLSYPASSSAAARALSSGAPAAINASLVFDSITAKFVASLSLQTGTQRSISNYAGTQAITFACRNSSRVARL